jgi:hypothetical protein
MSSIARPLLSLRTALAALLFTAALTTACVRLGAVDDRTFIHRAKVRDERLGRSDGFPVVIAIPLAHDARGPMGSIGRLAYDALFAGAGYPPFRFNVTFSCAHVDEIGRSAYADPRSIWFNVFFGYYELDVRQEAWGRPFGYRSTERGAEIVFEDVVRVGKADWNYFSNHIYGVPLEAIRPHDVVDMSRVRTVHHGRERIGDGYWDVIELWDLVVVSAYQAKRDKRRLEETFGDLTTLWLDAFGTTAPGDAFPTSFVPMKIHARMYMAHNAEGGAIPDDKGRYETYIFGATVNQDYPDAAENARFLDLQLEALRGVIAKHNRARGFADAGPPRGAAAPTSPPRTGP